MDRCYHRAAYEHHRAKAAAYRSKAEGHLARASAHHSRLGFGLPDAAQLRALEHMYTTTPCPCGCRGARWCRGAQWDYEDAAAGGHAPPWQQK